MALITIPEVFIFRPRNSGVLEWGSIIDGIADSEGSTVYVNDATVTATLYKGRDIKNPVITPGTIAAAEISGLVLGYVAASNGLYQGAIASTFDPPSGDGSVNGRGRYVLVVDADSPTKGIGHWENLAIVSTRTTE